MTALSNYQDRLVIVNSSMVGLRIRKPNRPQFHPMARNDWGTSDKIRGVLGRYYLQYPGTQGEALWNAGEALDSSQQQGFGVVGAGGGTVAAQFVGPNRGNNIPFNYSTTRERADHDAYPYWDEALNMEFSNPAWMSYDVSIPAKLWFDYTPNFQVNLGDLESQGGGSSLAISNAQRTGEGIQSEWGDIEPLYEQAKERLNLYVGTAQSMETPPILGAPAHIRGLLHGQLAPSANTTAPRFLDHTCQFHIPSADPRIREAAGEAFTIDPIYQQYIDGNPSYETVISADNIPEHILPNVYYLQLELQNGTVFPLAGGRYMDALTLMNQRLPDSATETPWFRRVVQNTPMFRTETGVGRFYPTYTRALLQALAEEKLSTTATKIVADLIVLHKDREVLEEDSINPATTPFYNKIIIPPSLPEGREVATNAGDFQVALLKSLADSTAGDAAPMLASGDPHDALSLLQYRVIQKLRQATPPRLGFDAWTRKPTSALANPGIRSAVTPTTYVDLATFGSLYDDLTNQDPADIDVTATAIAEKIDEDSFMPAPGGNPDIAFRAALLHKRATLPPPYADSTPDNTDPLLAFEVQAGSNFTRGYEEILHNAKCHVETLMYVVRKYRASNRVHPVQTFYFTNRFDGENIVYYDSQIKSKIAYRYEIDRILLVFGNQYGYTTFSGFQGQAIAGNSNESTEPDPLTVDIGIFNHPNIRILQVPYILGPVTVVAQDKPPVSPDISFYPFLGVNNRVKILLQSAFGEVNESPVAIAESDKSYFVAEYLSQTGIQTTYDNVASAQLTFKSDDPVDEYEIFRLTVPPTKYTDFASGRFFSVNPERGIPGSMTDTIRPNQKYYYCARSVDINKNISNPTFIHEIEMVDSAGQVYLTHDIFTLETTTQAVHTKLGRRYIYIEPSLKQLSLDDPLSIGVPVVTNAPNSSILGAPDSGDLWNKTFKIRVSSEKTGRKLDLNVTFKNTGIVNPSE